MHASGKQPGVLLSQLCRVVEALQAENRGRWTATVTNHRRIEVTDNDGHMISDSMYEHMFLWVSGRHVQQK